MEATHHSRRLLVKYKTTVESIRPLLDGLGVVEKHFKLIKTVLVRLHDHLTPEMVRQEVSDHDLIERAEYDFSVEGHFIPNDPLEGLTSQMGIVHKQCGIDRLWDISLGDPSVVVGIIDSGVDYAHPDLAANINQAHAAFVSQTGVTLTGGGFPAAISLRTLFNLSAADFAVSKFVPYNCNRMLFPKIPPTESNWNPSGSTNLYSDPECTTPIPNPITPNASGDELIVYTNKVVDIGCSTPYGGNWYPNRFNLITHYGLPVLPGDDLGGHGTAVAGIIAAVGSNSSYISGVAPNAKILSASALNKATLTSSGTSSQVSGYESDILACLEYLSDKCSIINMSLSTTVFSNSVRDMFKAVVEAGVTLVASSGNNSLESSVPKLLGVTMTHPGLEGYGAVIGQEVVVTKGVLTYTLGTVVDIKEGLLTTIPQYQGRTLGHFMAVYSTNTKSALLAGDVTIRFHDAGEWIAASQFTPEAFSILQCDYPDPPGVYPEIICVSGVTTGTNKKAAFAQLHSGVDIVAPATGLTSLVPTSGSFLWGSGLTYRTSLEGTSFAAPLITGACAVLKALHPEYPPADLMERIQSGGAHTVLTSDGSEPYVFQGNGVFYAPKMLLGMGYADTYPPSINVYAADTSVPSGSDIVLDIEGYDVAGGGVASIEALLGAEVVGTLQVEFGAFYVKQAGAHSRNIGFRAVDQSDNRSDITTLALSSYIALPPLTNLESLQWCEMLIDTDRTLTRGSKYLRFDIEGYEGLIGVTFYIGGQQVYTNMPGYYQDGWEGLLWGLGGQIPLADLPSGVHTLTAVVTLPEDIYDWENENTVDDTIELQVTVDDRYTVDDPPPVYVACFDQNFSVTQAPQYPSVEVEFDGTITTGNTVEFVSGLLNTTVTYPTGTTWHITGEAVPGLNPVALRIKDASAVQLGIAELTVVVAPEAPVVSGEFSIPSLTASPSISTPVLTGVRVGSFTLPGVAARPALVAPSLAGSRVGAFSLPLVTAQPVVTTPSLSGASIGTFSIPAVIVEPILSAPSLTGATALVGHFTLPRVILTPIITPPSLQASTGGVTIRAPDGRVLDLRRIDGTPITLHTAA